MVNLNKISIFLDSSDEKKILKYSKLRFIKGFTTNPSLMRKSGVKNYKTFAKNISKKIKKKPISFEVFGDDFKKMYEQALKINSLSKNIFVKIPIVNSKGQKTTSVIKKLSYLGVKLNITAVFTINQVRDILNNISKKSETIISIFAGRIADTGRDPEVMIKKSVAISSKFKKTYILWASTREFLSIYHAQKCKCHIITVPEEILKKRDFLNKNLNVFSKETVKQFNLDAKLSKFKL